MAIYTTRSTAEPGEAVEMISAAYVDVSLSLPPDRDGFRFAFDRFDGGAFQLDRMEIAAHAAFSYEPDQEYFVSTVGRGTLGVRQRGADDRLRPGEAGLIGRPGVETRTEVDAFRQGVVKLRAASLRAAAGLDPVGEKLPEFTSILPISAGHARIWRRGVDFVTATLSEDPAVLESPLVIGGTERLLAGLVLATFPNDAITLPVPRDERDARSPATLRRGAGVATRRVAGVPPPPRHHADRLPAPGPPRRRPPRTARRRAGRPQRHRRRLPLGLLLAEPLHRALRRRLRDDPEHDPAPLAPAAGSVDA